MMRSNFVRSRYHIYGNDIENADTEKDNDNDNADDDEEEEEEEEDDDDDSISPSPIVHPEMKKKKERQEGTNVTEISLGPGNSISRWDRKTDEK